MFTEKAQSVIDHAKGFAIAVKATRLDVAHVLKALTNDIEGRQLLAECMGLTEKQLRSAMGEEASPAQYTGKLGLTPGLRELLAHAKHLAQEVPERAHPGLVDVRHLAGGVALSKSACSLLRVPVSSEEAVTSHLKNWYGRDANAPQLDELTARLRHLRTELLDHVYGQEQAVHAFVEGVFNAELVAAADTERRGPRAVFVFCGPPGVGKTYLAELGATKLGKPFKRFDMSAYAGHQQNEALVGMARSFQGAHAGTLTEFVEKNPDAVLLFDEIEKAHLNTIHLFLQILDAGLLEDKYHERNVEFRDTLIIFTTNVGRKLYERPNESGVHAAHSAFHRRTILDALTTEKDPRTDRPYFPAAICSRLATGYPVLFNHLQVSELERVVRSALAKLGKLFEKQYYKAVSFHDLVPMCLVMREGGAADARTLCAQARSFVKTEIMKLCELFDNERLAEALRPVDCIRFALDASPEDLDEDVKALFESADRPRILLVANRSLARLYQRHVTIADWKVATTPEEALETLAGDEFDLLLLDLWLGRPEESLTLTVQQFDHVPMAARSVDEGQELLRRVRERLPDLPVYLLSLRGTPRESAASMDEELFMACVRGGGARGMIVNRFTDDRLPDWEEGCREFTATLRDVCERLYRQKAARRLAQERKVLSFDTAPLFDEEGREIAIRLRNLRLTRAIAASDASEIVEEVERPKTRFADVIGATSAKEELQFFLDYLKEPRRFAALGVKPPKGVLLYGPPGTGKTMLARALAGESNLAFVAASGANFVTIWQGSGPQNVRDLFARARRYAPAIVFIDEIDAIGRPRTGGPGSHAEENTLNALLTEMDGFTGPAPDRPVFVLAATNYGVDSDEPGTASRTLDPALVRRFTRAILVDLPERAAREEYLRKRLEGRAACSVEAETIRLIAERSVGMSIANLESILEAAARNAAKAGTSLSGKLLEEAFELIRFGEAKPRDAATVLRTARHEAGHTLLYWLSGWWPVYVTVVARGGHGGYMAPCAEELERRSSRLRSELLAHIRVCLAGRAVELLCYGPEAGLSTGCSQDLETATATARALVCRFGMSEEFGLLATPEILQHASSLASPLYAKVNDAAGKILREQMECTTQALEENRTFLDAVAAALQERERLTTADLQKVLPERGGSSEVE